jgi:lipopolysaccharide transport system permease protein
MARAEAVISQPERAARPAPQRLPASPLHKLRFYRDVTFHLAQREFALKNRGSLLGWLWSLAPALLQLLVMQFLFTRVIPLHVSNYPVFFLAGVLPWNWFSGALNAATTSLEQRRPLVLRPGFPTVLVPIAAVIVPLFDYLLALPILFGALAFTSGVPATALFMPVLVVIELILVAALGVLLAPLQIFFRDVTRMVLLATMIGFWLTPVFYQPDRVANRFSLIYDLNPMAHLINAQRTILLDGHLPGALALGLTACAAVALFGVAYGVYNSLQEALPDRL